MSTSSPAPEEAIRDRQLIADVRLAISNTPLLVPGTLFDLLCTTTYANDHTISALLHDAAVNAIAAWNRRAGGEREAVLASVCNEIVEIMQTRDEQEAAGIYGGTPGGLEHMGDVWRLLDRWRDTIARAALAGQTEGERNGG